MTVGREQWDTRRGEPARIQRWRLTRDAWKRVRRDDIELTGVEECRPVLGIGQPSSGTVRPT